MTRRGNVKKLFWTLRKQYVKENERFFPTKEEMIIRPQDDVEMSDEDAMRMQMAMSAMKDKSMTQRIEG